MAASGAHKRKDPATWTAYGMEEQLRSGTLGESYYKIVFGWDDEQLQQAIGHANHALMRAGIGPTQPLCRIRLMKGTDRWNPGAQLRLNAEANLVARRVKGGRLFSLPHERNMTAPPSWFRAEMMLAGRQENTQYDFPTIVQKFFQYARDKAKEDIGKDTAARKEDEAESPSGMAYDSASKMPARNFMATDAGSSPHNLDKTACSESSERSNPQLDDADVHTGWIIQQDNNSVILEKGFRSLGMWLSGQQPGIYDWDKVCRSLRMTKDSGLRLFWFKDMAGEPLRVRSQVVLAGAAERMHHKGDICFLLARSIDQVRALTLDQRDIAKQTSRNVVLNPAVADIPHPQGRKAQNKADLYDTDATSWQRGERPYAVPTISESLAAIFGEQAMKSPPETRGEQ